MKKPRKPTIKQLLAKFPNMVENVNCLTDFICPKCGNREHFGIEVSIVVTMHDDGTDDEGGGDTDWDRASYANCRECDMVGKAGDFIFDGLDAALAKRRQETK